MSGVLEQWSEATRVVGNEITAMRTEMADVRLEISLLRQQIKDCQDTLTALHNTLGPPTHPPVRVIPCKAPPARAPPDSPAPWPTGRCPPPPPPPDSPAPSSVSPAPPAVKASAGEPRCQPPPPTDTPPSSAQSSAFQRTGYTDGTEGPLWRRSSRETTVAATSSSSSEATVADGAWAAAAVSVQ